MAKQQKGQQQGGKTHTKCIKVVRSEKNGAYIFKEDVLPNERVEEFFKENGKKK